MSEATAATPNLHGDWTIGTINKCREIFLGLLDDNEASTAIDLSGVGRVDISFVQLVVAAGRSAECRGRPLVLRGVPDALRATFAGAGVDLDRL